MTKCSRVLIGVTERSAAQDVSALLNSTGVDLLISGVLLPGGTDAIERAQSVQLLYSSHSQLKLAWSLGGRDQGHLASLVGPDLVRQYQLLLLTLPGTPVFNYGDEIGLMDEVRTSAGTHCDTLGGVLLFMTSHCIICVEGPHVSQNALGL